MLIRGTCVTLPTLWRKARSAPCRDRGLAWGDSGNTPRSALENHGVHTDPGPGIRPGLSGPVSPEGCVKAERLQNNSARFPGEMEAGGLPANHIWPGTSRSFTHPLQLRSSDAPCNGSNTSGGPFRSVFRDGFSCL